jgi:hypothetical protein
MKFDADLRVDKTMKVCNINITLDDTKNYLLSVKIARLKYTQIFKILRYREHLENVWHLLSVKNNHVKDMYVFWYLKV